MALFSPDALNKVVNYIDDQPEFIKEICICLRKIIMTAETEITEKWESGPVYYYSGMVCGFTAAKNHVLFTFFNGSAMSDPDNLFSKSPQHPFSRSIQFSDADNINADTMKAYVKESVQINEMGFKNTLLEKIIDVPEDLEKALEKNPSAAQYFASLGYGKKKGFIEQVTSAKRASTRQRRIEKVVEMCAHQMKPNERFKK
jgi:uncharacterized protein YdeI (YjbR/CyaY-like superfamily)